MNGIIRYVFIDESGDPVLPVYNPEKPSIYVITALMVESINLENYRTRAHEVVQKHAGSGELKSSSIGTNVERRQQILNDIVTSGFQYYCFVVDKAKIWPNSGLRYHASFYKFLHQKCYNRIREACIEIDITADKYGNSDFMTQFSLDDFRPQYLFAFKFLVAANVILVRASTDAKSFSQYFEEGRISNIMLGGKLEIGFANDGVNSIRRSVGSWLDLSKYYYKLYEEALTKYNVQPLPLMEMGDR